MTKLSYKSADLQKMYVAINPNIEITERGFVWFNSGPYIHDNAYPNKLIDLYVNASAVHSHFINLKSNLIFGSGLVPLDENDLAIKAFLEGTNQAGENMNDIFKKLSLDMALHEGCALQVIYNAEGKIAEVYYCSPANIRADEPNADFGYVDAWYYSTRFGIVTNKTNRKPTNLISDAVRVPNFNPSKGVEDVRQITYIKKDTPSQNNIYAIPSYNSILPAIQTAYELTQFHLHKVQNSLSPSGIVVIKGNPTDEEQAEFVKNFKNKHTGSENAGKLLFIFSDGADQVPEFIRLEQDPNRGLYEELNDITNETIAMGHGGSMALLGKSESFFSDSNAIINSRAAFVSDIIEPMQEVILATINKILKHNGLGQVKVVNAPPVVAGATQADTNQSGTNNESGQPAIVANSATAKMSGKEYINMMRMIRNIKNGKLAKEGGIKLLKSSFALDDETIDALLADELEDDKITQPALN